MTLPSFRVSNNEASCRRDLSRRRERNLKNVPFFVIGLLNISYQLSFEQNTENEPRILLPVDIDWRSVYCHFHGGGAGNRNPGPKTGSEAAATCVFSILWSLF